MKYIRQINEFLENDSQGKNKFNSKEELKKYLKSEIERQGENVVIQNLDVSNLKDLSYLFEDITNGVRSLDLSGWNTSHVHEMDCMFYRCDSLESLNLSGWDVSNVVDMGSMFCGCESLESLDLSGWDTHNVWDMDNMLRNCPAPYVVVNKKIVKK